jgi:hypothetical protein
MTTTKTDTATTYAAIEAKLDRECEAAWTAYQRVPANDPRWDAAWRRLNRAYRRWAEFVGTY